MPTTKPSAPQPDEHDAGGEVISLGKNPRESLFGLLEGQIWIADDFDELSEDLLREFEEGHPDDPLLPQ